MGNASHKRDLFLVKVRRYIEENGLLVRADASCGASAVLVGLSGGMDSVCLLLVLRRLGCEVTAAHCNFRLRGEESDRDERFVRRLCEREGVELVVRHFDTAEYARTRKLGIEEAARKLRYAFFDELRDTLPGKPDVAVAHHIDDNVETVLLNMARGTGLDGLCGMSPRRGHVVRPLLCVTRAEIEEWMRAEGQEWVTDSSNGSDDYARNRVRHHAVPALVSVNPAALRNIAVMMENLRGVREENEVNRSRLQVAAVDCPNRPYGLQTLHERLAPLGFNRPQLVEMARVLADGGTEARRWFAGEWEVVVSRGSLEVSRPTRSPLSAIRLEDVLEVSRPTLREPTRSPLSAIRLGEGPHEVCIDADKVVGDLRLRHVRVGDRFAPFGMGGRTKLLSDFMTDQKMSPAEKERQLLLTDAENIVWVVGRRLSELYRVDENTKRVVELRIKNRTNSEWRGRTCSDYPES